MNLEGVRRAINRGLRPPVTDSEWQFLISEERYENEFNNLEDWELADLEKLERHKLKDLRKRADNEYCIVEARQTLRNLRAAFGMCSEPRSTVCDRAGGVSGVFSPLPGVGVPATPSDRVWGAIAVLQAWRLPEVKKYRERYLHDRLLSLEEIPAFLRAQSSVVLSSDEYNAPRRTGAPRPLTGRSVEYGDWWYCDVYKEGVNICALDDVLWALMERYLWSHLSGLEFVLSGVWPPETGSNCFLEEEPRAGGREVFTITVSPHLNADEVSALYTEARRYYKVRGARFSERTAAAVVFAVERMLQGKAVASIAREWSGDPRRAETFRKEVYRALARVGPALGLPTVHARGKTKGARRIRPERPSSA